MTFRYCTVENRSEYVYFPQQHFQCHFYFFIRSIPIKPDVSIINEGHQKAYFFKNIYLF